MGNRTRAFVAGTTVAAALLLSGCGTPAPEQATTTTTEHDLMRCRVERDTIEVALEAWAIEHDGYPSALQELVGVYLEDAPEFVWTYVSTGTEFTLTGAC